MKFLLQAKQRLLASEYKTYSWHQVPYGSKVGDSVILSGGYGKGKPLLNAKGVIVELKNGKAKIGITDEGTLKGYRGEVICDLIR